MDAVEIIAPHFIEIYRYYRNWNYGWNFNNFTWNYINSKSEEEIQHLMSMMHVNPPIQDTSDLRDHLTANVPFSAVRAPTGFKSIHKWLSEFADMTHDNLETFVVRMRGYPVKMILYIHAHGAFTGTSLKDEAIKMETATGGLTADASASTEAMSQYITVLTDYISAIKYTMEGVYGTCNYSSAVNITAQYNLLHEYTSEKPTTQTFGVRRLMRPITMAKMATIKDELCSDYELPFTPRRTSRRTEIQRNIDTESDNELVCAEITGPMHYWGSYNIDLHRRWNKIYTFYDDETSENRYRNVYVINTYGLPGAQIHGNYTQNSLWEILRRVVQFETDAVRMNCPHLDTDRILELIEQCRKNASERQIISLFTIMYLMFLLNIEIEIFDVSCNSIMDGPSELKRNPSMGKGRTRKKFKRR